MTCISLAIECLCKSCLVVLLAAIRIGIILECTRYDNQEIWLLYNLCELAKSMNVFKLLEEDLKRLL